MRESTLHNIIFVKKDKKLKKRDPPPPPQQLLLRHLSYDLMMSITAVSENPFVDPGETSVMSTST